MGLILIGGVGEPREFANRLMDQFVCDRYEKMARPHMCMFHSFPFNPLFPPFPLFRFGLSRSFSFASFGSKTGGREIWFGEICLSDTRNERNVSSLTDWGAFFASKVLVYLVVHPEHRRRGIGRQLINWGKSVKSQNSPPPFPPKP